MSDIEANNYNLLVILVTSGIFFIILSSPYVYLLTNKKFEKHGLIICTEEGLPYAAGIVVHMILFVIILSIALSKNLTYSVSMITFITLLFLIL